jgi:uncharacterized protein YutE (UPF0331/DUF86 family)
LVDSALIMRKLAELDLYLQQVGEFQMISLDDYRNDWKTQRIVERTLQMMIETCADVANHLVAGAAMRPPTSYADTFRVLAENETIPLELAAVMEKMAKFRNIVVHQYESIDAEIVILVLRKHLSDFDRFKNAVLNRLKHSTR